MVGKEIYIVTCYDYESGNRQVMTCHASFDGAKKKLSKIARDWECIEYKTEPDYDMLDVRDFDGTLAKTYKILTRKIVD